MPESWEKKKGEKSAMSQGLQKPIPNEPVFLTNEPAAYKSLN
jgi:hypothetical protein